MEGIVVAWLIVLVIGIVGAILNGGAWKGANFWMFLAQAVVAAIGLLPGGPW